MANTSCVICEKEIIKNKFNLCEICNRKYSSGFIKNNVNINVQNIYYWQSCGYSLKDSINIIRIFNKPHISKFFNVLKNLSFFKDFKKENFKETILDIRKKLITLKFKNISDLPNFGHSSRDKNYWIFRGFTSEESELKVKEIQRRNSSRCIEYWIYRNFTEEHAIQKIKEIQKINSKKNIEKSNLLYKEDKNLYKTRNKGNLLYWTTRGYDIEEAKIKRQEFADLEITISLEKFIRKYGVKEGNKKYQQWCDVQKIKHTYEHFLNIRNIEDSVESVELFLKVNSTKATGVSKLQIEIIEKILALVDLTGLNVYYGEHEFTAYDPLFKKSRKYDFVITNNINYVLEINGDIFHANPKIYKETEKPNPWNDKTSKELWDEDFFKREYMLNKGFVYSVLWEKDYRENSYLCIQKIVDEIKLLLINNKE